MSDVWVWLFQNFQYIVKACWLYKHQGWSRVQLIRVRVQVLTDRVNSESIRPQSPVRVPVAESKFQTPTSMISLCHMVHHVRFSFFFLNRKWLLSNSVVSLLPSKPKCYHSCLEEIVSFSNSASHLWNNFPETSELNMRRLNSQDTELIIIFRLNFLIYCFMFWSFLLQCKCFIGGV